MNAAVEGLHHVMLPAGAARRNLEFHTGVPGLRRVKTTVTFDNPDVYHLYYGDTRGRPGTVITHFPFGTRARRRR